MTVGFWLRTYRPAADGAPQRPGADLHWLTYEKHTKITHIRAVVFAFRMVGARPLALLRLLHQLLFGESKLCGAAYDRPDETF